MGVFDKFKDGISNFINVPENDIDDVYGEEPLDRTQPVYQNQSREIVRASEAHPVKREKKGNILSMNRNAAPTNIAESRLVVKKVTGVAEVGAVADTLKQGYIVVLNLESCAADQIQRVIDILYGVSYGINGHFTGIAEKAFVITPYNTDIADNDFAAALESSNE